MSQPSKLQPSVGDRILGCRHAATGSKVPLHWWKAELEFRRSDSSSATAQWLTSCEECCVEAKFDPMQLPVEKDFVWLPGDTDLVIKSGGTH